MLKGEGDRVPIVERIEAFTYLVSFLANFAMPILDPK